MKLTLFLSVIILLFTALSCNTTETDEDNVIPGSRDYEWTVDTIKIPFTYLYRLSGSSSSDVWAVGPGGGLDQTMWHFDGTSWNTDGVSRMISPLCIISFAKNNVWIAGSEGNIWQFNGSEWKSKYKFVKSGYISGFWDVWGTDSTNIFAVGYADSGSIRKAVILNYNGKTWAESKIPDYSYEFIRIKKDRGGKGKYYIRGEGYQDGNIGLFEFDGKNISNIYEEQFSLATAVFPQEIGGKLFLTKGNTIYTIENGNYNEIKVVNEPNFGIQFFGRSEKDIFLRMLDGIAHYNGSDIEYLYRFNSSSDISISDAVVFYDEVFFLANDFTNDQNLIFRGKLKTSK